jgi:hypothetical protein
MRAFLLPFAAALFFAMSHATDALAEDPPAAAPAPAATQWYGWQTLAADLGAVGVMNVGFWTRGDSGQGAIILTGVGVYALGGPAVHVFHDRPDTAVADLALRLGAPLALGLVGYGIGVATFQGCPEGSWFCGRELQGFTVGALGVLAGSLTAVVLDAAWLAREPAAWEKEGSAKAPALRWSPQVGVTARGGPSVGVAGSF